MTYKNRYLFALGVIAGVALGVGAAAWLIAVAVVNAELANEYESNPIVLAGAYTWQTIGGTFFAFGTVALVAFLHAKANAYEFRVRFPLRDAEAE
jgi:hypothetical protein